MQNINSDQLRKLLKKHTRKMNWLAEQNDLIVATLKQRGLQAVDPAGDDISIHHCIMQLDKLQSEPKPLTADELKAGGWWCDDVSEECQRELSNRKLEFKAPRWDGKYHFCFMHSGRVYRGFSRELARVMCDDKQIHRIGNNFYWGAASDQAN